MPGGVHYFWGLLSKIDRVDFSLNTHSIFCCPGIYLLHNIGNCAPERIYLYATLRRFRRNLELVILFGRSFRSVGVCPVRWADRFFKNLVITGPWSLNGGFYLSRYLLQSRVKTSQRNSEPETGLKGVNGLK